MLTRPWLLFVAVVAVTFAVFSPLIRADFTAWDDPKTLSQNPQLHPPTWADLGSYWITAGEAAPMGLYVPVTYTVWSAASIPHGPRPDVIHAINILLHALTAGLVFLLLLRFVPAFPAVVGSLIFALHPVQVEPVGWASGTKDLLCGFFSVATLLIETASGRSRNMRSLAFGCFVLAMLSKPTAMVVPLMLLAWDFCCGTGTLPMAARLRSTLIRRTPWLLTSVLCAAVTAISQPVPWQPTLPMWTRPIVALDAIAFYLHHLVWPAQLCMDYGRTPQVLFSSPAVWWTWIVPVAIAGLIHVGRPRPTAKRPAGGAGDIFSVAVAWFIAPLLPVLGLVPFDFQYFSTVADHYLYLPMTGIAMAVALLVSKLPARKSAIPIGVIAVVLCVLTVRQERTWMNTTALAGQAIAVNPRTFAGHDLLGYENFFAGVSDPSPAAAQQRYDAAIAQYTLALANNPAYVFSMTNLAHVEHRAGRSKEALDTLHRLVELQPSLPPRMRDRPDDLARDLYAYGDPEGARRLLMSQPHAGTSP